MNLKTLVIIKNNPYISRYLQENSYWYKSLNRNPFTIKELEREMKERYKMTAVDRIESLGRKIEFVQNFMELLN